MNTSEYNHQYYLRNKKKLLETQRQKYVANPQNFAEIVKKYRSTPKGTLTVQRMEEKKRSEYRQKVMARKTLNNEVVAGRIFRKPCDICGIDKTEAHHADYSKPLEVIWLCASHHRRLHRDSPDQIL